MDTETLSHYIKCQVGINAMSLSFADRVTLAKYIVSVVALDTPTLAKVHEARIQWKNMEGKK